MERRSGARLGQYEIIAPLGAGGMGEVYRGKDPRLKREVAIKILSESGQNDPERRKRFEYEAQAASALNHPNILVVFDIGTENNTPYIVSELVEGESLRKLVQRGPLPVKRLLDLAVQIADGLSAAHQAGIVHRDLKPENILVNTNDRIKIVDFGLAKLRATDDSADDLETISRKLTMTGMVQGTVPYMSPEQASGKSVDFRSDQFSFGLILYEMATGKRAFSRDTPAQTLSAIISEEPEPVSALNSRTPAPLRWLIDQCLAKEPRHRFDSTADLYRDLRNLRDHLSETTSVEARPSTPLRFNPRRYVLSSLLALILVATGFLVSRFGPFDEEADSSRYRYTAIADDSVYEGQPAWSPDGEAVAFLKRAGDPRQVFLRALSSSTPAQLTNSVEDCFNPFWDPDGSRVFYLTPSGLWYVNVAGGESQKMFEKIEAAAISPDGQTLAMYRNPDLLISSPPGSEPRKHENSLSNMRSMFQIKFAPDGKSIGAWVDTSGELSFWRLPYPTGKPTEVQLPAEIENGSAFSFMPDSRSIVFGGHWFGGNGHLSLVDTKNGKARPITAGYKGGESEPAVSADGRRIAFAATERDWDLLDIPVDGSAPHSWLSTSNPERSPSLSPAGNQVVYAGERNGNYGVWLTSPGKEWIRPLVTSRDFDPERSILFDNPTVSPDSQRVAYQVNSNEIYVSSIAGGKPTRLVSPEYAGDGPSWSPDGNWIVFLSGKPRPWALARIKLGAAGKPEILIHDVQYHMPRWSPNGDWITCLTDDGLTLVSSDGKKTRLLSKGAWGAHSCWSPDGSLVYGFNITDQNHWVLCSVDINTLELKLINDIGNPGFAYWGLSVSPDKKSFLTSVSRWQNDIWMLEGFEQPSGFWRHLVGR